MGAYVSVEGKTRRSDVGCEVCLSMEEREVMNDVMGACVSEEGKVGRLGSQHWTQMSSAV